MNYSFSIRHVKVAREAPAGEGPVENAGAPGDGSVADGIAHAACVPRRRGAARERSVRHGPLKPPPQQDGTVIRWTSGRFVARDSRCRPFGYSLFEFNQPGGLDAMREETEDSRGSSQPPSRERRAGRRLRDLPNIHGKHMAALERTTGPAFERQDSEHVDRWRYASTRPSR